MRFRFRRFALVFVGLIAVTALHGDDGLEQGLEAFRRGDYAEAITLWRPIADQGHAVAAFNMGVMYAQGLGVEVDPVEALNWYERSASAGYADAQFNLGSAFYNGLGTPVDKGRAIDLWRKAAQQDQPQALFNLGMLHKRGTVVERDLEQALKLFEAAEAAGDSRATEEITAIRAALENQESTRPQPGSAGGNWLERQNPEHWTVQIFAFGELPAALAFLEKQELNEDVAVYRAQANGKTWFKGVYGAFEDKDSAKQAQARLTAKMPDQGPWLRSIGNIKSEALEVVYPAASQTNTSGNQEQAEPAPDPTPAESVDQPAAAEAAPTVEPETPSESVEQPAAPEAAPAVELETPPENTESIAPTSEVAVVAETVDDDQTAGTEDVAEDRNKQPETEVEEQPAGETVTTAAASTAANPTDRAGSFRRGQAAFNAQRYDEAIQHWEPLAATGMPEAQYGMGFLYESGWGVERNYQQAFRWYQLAAQQGHEKAQFNLGLLYGKGLGVAKSRALSLYWIQSAADGGDTRAQQYIKDEF